jgi:hypothetical protein
MDFELLSMRYNPFVIIPTQKLLLWRIRRIYRLYALASAHSARPAHTFIRLDRVRHPYCLPIADTTSERKCPSSAGMSATHLVFYAAFLLLNSGADQVPNILSMNEKRFE